MVITRRVLITAALAAAATAAVGVVAFAGPSGAPPAGRGKYHPGPGGPRNGPGSMIMQDLNGKWVSHLLPFAAPFPNRASLAAELARAKAKGLVR